MKIDSGILRSTTGSRRVDLIRLIWNKGRHSQRTKLNNRQYRTAVNVALSSAKWIRRREATEMIIMNRIKYCR